MRPQSEPASAGGRDLAEAAGGAAASVTYDFGWAQDHRCAWRRRVLGPKQRGPLELSLPPVFNPGADGLDPITCVWPDGCTYTVSHICQARVFYDKRVFGFALSLLRVMRARAVPCPGGPRGNDAEEAGVARARQGQGGAHQGQAGARQGARGEGAHGQGGRDHERQDVCVQQGRQGARSQGSPESPEGAELDRLDDGEVDGEGGLATSATVGSGQAGPPGRYDRDAGDWRRARAGNAGDAGFAQGKG